MKKAVNTREKMYSHIQLWEQSGQSQKSYCLEAGITFHIFYYWYRKYQKDKTVCSDFIQVPVNVMPGSCFAECHFANGSRLILHQPVHADYLKALAG